MTRQFTIEDAKACDKNDPLAHLRDKFVIPTGKSGKPLHYFCGNSLGLAPKNAKTFVLEEIDAWEKYAVEGHFKGRNPWMPYHELVSESLSRLAGARPSEVVAMNSLTVNLHLLMATFYRPTERRYKILIEDNAFPSDRYAVTSQVRFHGFEPKNAVIEAHSSDFGIVDALHNNRDSIALVLIGGVNYLSGKVFDFELIAKETHKIGAYIGLDLAHAIGNIPLELHDMSIDFAAWCHYKYVNAGPGAIGGAFVHDKFHSRKDLSRFEGWWGHDKSSRFSMPQTFVPIRTVEAWQLSNPPILQLAALRASLEIFDMTSMKEIRLKSQRMTSVILEALLELHKIELLTPRNSKERGSQLSLRASENPKKLQDVLTARNIVSDFREPDVVRVAPAPLYTQYEDVHALIEGLKEYAN